MKKLLVLALVASGLMVGASPPTASVAQSTPPNVVVIILDDARKDHLDRMAKTQSLLVDKGVSFENAIIAEPICCPSRAIFLRGQYAHTTTAYDVQYEWGGWLQYKEAKIEQQMLNTWFDPTHFTGLIGKYTNGYDSVAPPGPAGSWDYLAALNKVGYASGTWSVTNGTKRTFPADYSTDYLADRAVEAIGASGTEPVFLWTGFYAPHNPYLPPARYDTAAEAPQCADVDLRGLPSFNEAGKQTSATPPGLKDKPRWMKNRGAYSASKQLEIGVTNPTQQCRALLAVDDGIEEIIAALEVKDPGLDNTVVVLTSDQGVQQGQHNHIPKTSPHEETVNVPMVVRADGLTGEFASSRPELVSNIDLAPTLLELAGLPMATPGCPQTGDHYQTRCEELGHQGFDGQSFMPAIAGGAFAGHDAVLIEHWDPNATGHVPTYCAIRTPTAKLVRYVRAGTSVPDWEAYDLVADPNELDSVVYSNTDGVVRFRSNGQAIYDALYPTLVSMCDPRPPGYPGF